MAVKAIEVVEAARRLLGAPYRWWDGNFPFTPGPAMYVDHVRGRYTRDYVLREGINCTGLINWARAECGLPTIGGTLAYERWIRESGEWVPYDPNVPGDVGALVGAPFEGPGAAEGHVAMISTPDQYVIQATPNEGVNENHHDWETHW